MIKYNALIICIKQNKMIIYIGHAHDNLRRFANASAGHNNARTMKRKKTLTIIMQKTNTKESRFKIYKCESGFASMHTTSIYTSFHIFIYKL